MSNQALSVTDRARPALSPTRAADFKQCPLLYRFRAIDRLPEPSSTAQLRGSLVHAALEKLYGMPAIDRVPETAASLVGPEWDRVIAAHPELTEGLEPDQHTQILAEARALLNGYYRLEDPTRFDPQSCEQRIEVELADGVLLRGCFEKTLTAIWRAIESAGATGEFHPNRTWLCRWCSHQSLCPAFGGTPPPYPGWPA